jgi:hypothetical protein
MARAVLAHRCWNHAERTAVAKCQSCGRNYCRECVAEHDGRMTCAACLRQSDVVHSRSRNWVGSLWRCGQTVAAVFVAWLCFHGTGWLLLKIPSPMHEGTFWKSEWWKEDR